MPTIDYTLNYCKLTKIISMYEKIIYILKLMNGKANKIQNKKKK